MKPALILACLAAPLIAADQPATGDGSFSWQATPVASPVGGAKFASSAFIHPLKTPSGFVLTTIQPSDHLHHFGVWWPWKFVEVDGTRYNTWEIQEGQGGHAAVAAKQVSSEGPVTTWELSNRTVIKPKGARPVTAIEETTKLASRRGDDANVIDIEISQRAAGSPVKIVEYRYSGLSWRGASSWNKDNSVMLTSAGKGRDDANGTLARWVVVSGDSPKGKASLLIMSAAVKTAGTEEKVRVWDSKAHNGAPFVNFNPVMDKPLMLEAGNKSVAHRKYRLIAADHAITAAEAEDAWKKWTGK